MSVISAGYELRPHEDLRGLREFEDRGREPTQALEFLAASVILCLSPLALYAVSLRCKAPEKASTDVLAHYPAAYPPAPGVVRPSALSVFPTH